MKCNRIITTLLVISFLVSCNRNDEVGPQTFLNADKTSLNFPPESTTDSIVISSTGKWKITKPANLDWLYFNKDSGTAGNTVVYLMSTINPQNSKRTGSLTVNPVDFQVSPVQVTITQDFDLKVGGTFPGGAEGGATISLMGRGFSLVPAENIVTINGANTTVQSATHTLLQLTVPQSAGSGPVIVSVNGKKDTADAEFEYYWVGVVTVIAGSTPGYLDGNGVSAMFEGPQGMTFDNANNMILADYANSKMRKITPTYNVTTLPGRFPSWMNPTGPNTDFALPTNVKLDATGNIYVVEFNSHSISKITTGGNVSLFAGGLSPGLVNAVGTSAAFNGPVDLAIDGSGNLYVADKENYCIRKITPGAVVTTLAGGPGGYQDGTGLGARFNRPMGICIDPSGNLYVSDHFNNRIRKVTPAGVVTTFAGSGMHGSKDGPKLEAQFTNPYALAFGNNGVLYITESDGDNQVRMINQAGRVETIHRFQLSSGAPYQFTGIFGLAVDNNGDLYATDYHNARVCKFYYK